MLWKSLAITIIFGKNQGEEDKERISTKSQSGADCILEEATTAAAFFSHLERKPLSGIWDSWEIFIAPNGIYTAAIKVPELL